MLCVLEASAVFPQCLQSFVCFREQCKMIDDLVQRFPRQWREDSTSCEIIQYHCSFIGSMQSVTSAQLSLLRSSFAPTPACDVPGILGDTHGGLSGLGGSSSFSTTAPESHAPGLYITASPVF